MTLTEFIGCKSEQVAVRMSKRNSDHERSKNLPIILPDELLRPVDVCVRHLDSSVNHTHAEGDVGHEILLVDTVAVTPGVAVQKAVTSNCSTVHPHK